MECVAGQSLSFGVGVENPSEYPNAVDRLLQ
jgi:hypothetical protein